MSVQPATRGLTRIARQIYRVRAKNFEPDKITARLARTRLARNPLGPDPKPDGLARKPDKISIVLFV